MDDWYNVRQGDITSIRGGAVICSYYNSSPSQALQSVYPEHKWELEKFKNKPKHYWTRQENQKKYFDRLMTQLGYKCMEDWYNVTYEDINRNEGGGLLSYYNSSPSLMLQGVYPEHNWMIWRFKTVPLGYWNKLMKDSKEIKRMVDWLSGQLAVKCLDDWYRIALAQVEKWARIGSAKILGTMLQSAYPQHQWNIKLFDRVDYPVKASQREVMVALQHLFPTHKVEEDYKHPKMMHSSGSNMELDVYIESLELAVEYQGVQHYKPMYWTSTDFETQQIRDEEKRRACKQYDITLIEVPYWWDRTTESLAATIHKVRSELISDPPEVEPIPTSCPTLTKNALDVVPLSHGCSWDGLRDVTGWWMSEKMDGVRAYWNGEKLVSRQGNVLSCPLRFTSKLPTNITLDGELWMGQGTTYESLNKVLKSKNGDWSQIGYYVFDIPSSPGSYEERMEEMETIKVYVPPHVHVVENIRCTGTDHLRAYLNSIVAAQGEGVMLRQPHSLYLPELTTTLLKVKKFEDTEVTVLEVLDNGLYCQQQNGLTCTVKCFQSTLDCPPRLGSTITVKHHGAYATGTLKNAVYWRESQNILLNSTKVHDWRNPNTHKAFFDGLAQLMNISQPTDWYRVTKEDIYEQGGQKLLQEYYGNSLYKALIHWYPNINIFPWMFEEYVPMGFWKSTNNHWYNHCSILSIDMLKSKYFDWLMTQLGYKSMDDWYNVSHEDIYKNGGQGLVSYYNSSPSQALQSVYPEHTWELERFKNKPVQLRNNHQGRLFMQSVFPEHDWVLPRSKAIPPHFWEKTDKHKQFFDWLYDKL